MFDDELKMVSGKADNSGRVRVAGVRVNIVSTRFRPSVRFVFSESGSCRPISAKCVQRVFFRFSNTVFGYGFRMRFSSTVFVIDFSNSLFVSIFWYDFSNIFVQYFVIYN